MYDVLAIILQYFSGSIMYSYLIAKYKGIDLKKIRDGNPGSSNVWRVLNWRWGLLALVLDYFKGIFPLFLFVITGIVTNKYIIAFAALSGILGHAFSPMLRFRGGKAIATTFGAWTVLTKWEVPVLLGAIFTIYGFIKKGKKSIEEDAFRVLLGYALLIPYILYKLHNGELHLLIFYLGSFLIIGYKHWNEWKRLF